MTPSLLIADDARDVAEVVGFIARMAWPDCRISIATDGEETLRRFATDQPHLVVLDVEMPPPDGFDVCRRIRETSSVPIMMLTVRDATIDKVWALDHGADDYLTKPFDHHELLARLRALLRRGNGNAWTSQTTFVSGELEVDFSTQEVHIKGELIRLTSTEYRLLEELVRHAGSVVPHLTLLERVWGSEWAADPSYLKVFVRRLRQKLGDDADRPRYIRTEWGIGYRFISPGDAFPSS